MILVDSNIWIDVIQEDPVWLDWSLAQLQQARETNRVVINPIIYAELAPTYDEPEQLDHFLKVAKAALQPLPRPAAYAAGRAFLQYRQKRGSKTGVLPDFFIGAHAQTEGWAILTRDVVRYATYFPNVKLIAP